ncbi:MAG: hypothetical protein ACE5IB_04420 [Candidatus Geothermarchaeales archaeon]
MNRSQGWIPEPSSGTRTVGGFLKKLISVELGIILALSSFMLAIAAFYAQYSPVLRWALLIVFLLIGGWIAGKFVYIQTVKIRPLGRGEPQPWRQESDLANLSASLRRGARGMRYSQLSFVTSIRDAFIEKIRAESGFQGDVHELKDDMPLLELLCKDKELFRFLYRVSVLERSMADILSSSEEILPGEPSSFVVKMERLLMKMEAWP